MVVVVVYCVEYIILLCCLYYFNVLNNKIKPFDVEYIIKWGVKIDKVVFWVAKNYIFSNLVVNAPSSYYSNKLNINLIFYSILSLSFMHKERIKNKEIIFKWSDKRIEYEK